MVARLSFFTALTVLGAMAGNVLAQNSTCRATYTVVSGDNCVAIAAKFNVSDPALLAANPAVDANCDNLFVGQQLCIPPPPAGCAAQYTVVSGDNCVAIAAKFNVADSALLAANPAVDSNCDNLSVGQVLCIPPPPTGCVSQYTVKSGDVCISIADQFGITAAQLQAANTQIDAACDNLQVGELLCIPAASS
ncbi:hypothetical protein GYMLUDRAFT_35142 [Collybiopsis luxurians FD-317 M1]|nr:hypothetical protein GYMLUDRAFT_35142 [Collybiopsis luxurians FD-317 M1]